MENTVRRSWRVPIMHGDDVVESKRLIGSDLQNHRERALASCGCKRHRDRCTGRCRDDRAAIQKYLRRPAEAAQVEHAAVGLHALPGRELRAIQHMACTFGSAFQRTGQRIAPAVVVVGTAREIRRRRLRECGGVAPAFNHHHWRHDRHRRRQRRRRAADLKHCIAQSRATRLQSQHACAAPGLHDCLASPLNKATCVR